MVGPEWWIHTLRAIRHLNAYVQRWDGSSWQTEAALGPRAGTADLVSVSCVSDSYCVAVGAVEGPSSGALQLLIESWDGVRWEAQSPSGEPGTMLNSVSCIAPDSCVAVGFGYRGKSLFPLVERLTEASNA